MPPPAPASRLLLTKTIQFLLEVGDGDLAVLDLPVFVDNLVVFLLQPEREQKKQFESDGDGK
jgi:hypothetical protein